MARKTLALDTEAWTLALGVLTPEQRGAVLSLALASWRGTDGPPLLPDDAWQLAGLSGLRDRWARVAEPVRAMLVPVDPGFVALGLVLDAYHVACEKTARRRSAGSKGGRPKKDSTTNTKATENQTDSKAPVNTKQRLPEEKALVSGSPTKANAMVSHSFANALPSSPQLSARTRKSAGQGERGDTPPLKGGVPPSPRPDAVVEWPDDSPLDPGVAGSLQTSGRLFDAVPLVPHHGPRS